MLSFAAACPAPPYTWFLRADLIAVPHRPPSPYVQTPLPTRRTVMILTFFGFLARVGVFISAIITLGLNGKFFTNTDYGDDLLIYIIALSSFSAIACLIPPYPNFVYDLFWALANALCAVFALVVQVGSSQLLVEGRLSDTNMISLSTPSAMAFDRTMASTVRRIRLARPLRFC